MIAPGQRVGKYVIERRLGAGGMGEVYRGYDATLQRPVAIKVLPEADELSPEARARMLREARAASALRHPNIVMVLEVGEDDDRTYLVMELVEGETLADLVKRRGALPVAEALGLVRQIGAALEAAHQAGIVHRDVKTANLMLDGHGAVKVLDFGLSKRMVGPDAPAPKLASVAAGTVPRRLAPALIVDDATRPGSSARGAGGGAAGTGAEPDAGTAVTIEAPNRPALGDDLTVVGAGMGTAGCSAPELMDGRPADGRADVFSLGVVLYELLTARRPYDGETWDAIRAQIGVEDYRAPGQLGVPDSIGAVIVRALRPDPAQRWPSAAALVAALDAATAQRRQRAPWRVIGALAALGIIAGAALFIRSRDGAAVARPPLDAAPAPVVVALAVDAAVEPDAISAPAGPTPVPLTALAGCAQRPAFLDDDTVVFDLGRGGSTDVWALDLTAGAAPRALTSSPADECCAARGRTPTEVVVVVRDRADRSRSSMATLDLTTGAVAPLAAGEQRAAAAAGAVYLYLTGDGRELRRWADQQDARFLDVAGVRPTSVTVDRAGRRLVLAGDGEQAVAAMCTVELAAPAVACRPAHRPLAVRADFGATGAIYYGSDDGVRVLDARGDDRVVLAGARASGGLAVSPAGGHLVFSDCTPRGTVRDLGGATGSPAPTGPGQLPGIAIDTGADDQIDAVATGPGGRLIYLNATDQLVVRSPDGTTQRMDAPVGHTFLEPQLDASGTRIAVPLAGGAPGLYAGTVSASLTRLTDSADDTRPLFLADGSLLFTRGTSVLRVVAGGDPEIAVFAPRRALAIDRQVGRVLLVDDDGALTWWAPRGGAESPGPALPGPDGARVADAAIAPGGAWLAVRDDRGRLWRVRLDGAGAPTAIAAGAALTGLAITDDGHVLAVASDLRGGLWRVDALPGTAW